MNGDAAIRVGDLVKVVRVPEQVKGLHPGTVQLFRQCVGKMFPIAGINPHGLLEIEVADETSGAFRGWSDTIWIEPDCVELASVE